MLQAGFSHLASEVLTRLAKKLIDLIIGWGSFANVTEGKSAFVGRSFLFFFNDFHVSQHALLRLFLPCRRTVFLIEYIEARFRKIAFRQNI